MIEIITDKKLITKHQTEFARKLKLVCAKPINCKLGHLGSSDDNTVYYSEEFDFWFTTHRSTNRYWNGFGIGKPETGRITSITAEINPPYEGINRSIGGAFGYDSDGEVLVLHRGQIGGGKAGIGKKLFFDNFRGDFDVANDGDRETDFCVIGSLNSKHFAKQVLNFVQEVARIKSFDIQKKIDFSDLEDFEFRQEQSGRSETTRGKITIDRTHGIVVNALAKELEKKGFKIGNDRQRDLFTHKNGLIKNLFEFKSSSSTQNLYTAVGQLIIYSIPIKNPVQLVLVLPDKLKKEIETRLNELDLKILYYKWTKEEIIFINLTKLV